MMRYFKNSEGQVKAFEPDTDPTWFEGLVEISDDEAMDLIKPTLDQIKADIERRRSVAYADPATGSDRLFAEAVRMREMDEAGWEDVRSQAIARYLEIKEEFPQPA